MSTTAPRQEIRLPRRAPAKASPSLFSSLSERWGAGNSEFHSDPAGWVESRMGEHLWSKQREIMESLRDHRFTAVRSCHGSGKSFTASRALAWWVDTHPDAFAVSTAPTGPQVYAILWRELQRAHRRGGLDGYINLSAEWYVDRELRAYGRKPADHDPDGFQGIHAPGGVLVVIDEAGGIPAQLWTAVESLVTNEDSRVLAIGNPDDPNTEFEKVCRPGSGWNVVHISAFDAPAFTGEPVPPVLERALLTRQWVAERGKRWGKDSPLYKSKVLGEFPEVSEDVLFGPAVIRAACELELPGLEIGQFGVDVARFGDDMSEIYRNRGGVIRHELTLPHSDTMNTTGHVARLLREVPAAQANVDVIGVGAGVFDRLNEQGLLVSEFNASNRATERHRFANLRAEVYWNFRDAMIDGEVDLDPDDDQLLSQLQTIRYKVDSAGRILLESKDQLRARGLPSPDRADAAVMSWWRPRVLDKGWDKDAGTHSLTSDLLERAM